MKWSVLMERLDERRLGCDGWRGEWKYWGRVTEIRKDDGKRVKVSVKTVMTSPTLCKELFMLLYARFFHHL